MTKHSINVFLEELLTADHYETTYYVTQNVISTEFFWDRKSGIRIHIMLDDIRLTPEYQDVRHQDDNLFFLHSDSTDRAYIRDITRDFCRLVKDHSYIYIYHIKKISRFQKQPILPIDSTYKGGYITYGGESTQHTILKHNCE